MVPGARFDRDRIEDAARHRLALHERARPEHVGVRVQRDELLRHLGQAVVRVLALVRGAALAGDLAPSSAALVLDGSGVGLLVRREVPGAGDERVDLAASSPWSRGARVAPSCAAGVSPAEPRGRSRSGAPLLHATTRATSESEPSLMNVLMTDRTFRCEGAASIRGVCSGHCEASASAVGWLGAARSSVRRRSAGLYRDTPLIQAPDTGPIRTPIHRRSGDARTGDTADDRPQVGAAGAARRRHARASPSAWRPQTYASSESFEIERRAVVLRGARAAAVAAPDAARAGARPAAEPRRLDRGRLVLRPT